MSGYRCREHLDQPVTWKGTGCPDCAAARTGARVDHSTRRRAGLVDAELLVHEPDQGGVR